MSERASHPIIPVDDATLDDPDTGLIETLNDSDRPERVLRAQRLAVQKIKALEWRLAQRERVRGRK